MEHEKSSVEIFEKFTWKLENFSRLKTDKVRSEPFVLGGYPWRILLHPKGTTVVGKYLSIYLEAVETANMSNEWSRDVKFKLIVFTQLNTNMTITKEFNIEFNASWNHWGFPSFMPLHELHDPQKGFLVKDVCIVGAEVLYCKSINENQVNQAFSTPVFIEPTKHTHAELFSPSIQELMDFNSIGQLDGLFSDKPSFIEPQQKRSCTVTDLAFATLGRVLYFLKTRKVRDMNDQSCKDLQILWEELKKFRFDLSWLEPHVQSALGRKSYVEKAVLVEKLKENVVALELETERLKVKLGAAELNLDIERDLLKAKGFEERELDSDLGCGSLKT